MSSAARLFSHPPGHEIALHEHSQGQLTVVLGGTANVYNDQGWWLATPGTAIWVPPYIRHRAVYHKQADVINLSVDIESSDELAQHCCLVLVSGLLRELAREAARLGAAVEQRVAGSINELVLSQLRANTVNSLLHILEGKDKRLRQVTARLRADPGIADDLDTLASQAFTSARTLARLFLKETGMTFTQWRERLRVVVAVERLIAGQPISTIALDVGYQSASAFTAVFTRAMGSSPRKYLAQMLFAR